MSIQLIVFVSILQKIVVWLNLSDNGHPMAGVGTTAFSVSQDGILCCNHESRSCRLPWSFFNDNFSPFLWVRTGINFFSFMAIIVFFFTFYSWVNIEVCVHTAVVLGGRLAPPRSTNGCFDRILKTLLYLQTHQGK